MCQITVRPTGVFLRPIWVLVWRVTAGLPFLAHAASQMSGQFFREVPALLFDVDVHVWWVVKYIYEEMIQSDAPIKHCSQMQPMRIPQGGCAIEIILLLRERFNKANLSPTIQRFDHVCLSLCTVRAFWTLPKIHAWCERSSSPSMRMLGPMTLRRKT